MFKEVLQIIPKLSNSDLSAMERSLSSRFKKVAKGFGKGLVGALTGGGIAGAAIGLIDKLLNPLKETQDAIDRSLSKADEIADAAKQFNTSAANMARLQAFGKASGLDAGQVQLLLQKFQTAVAEAKADPKQQSAVRAFVDDKDTAQSFFQFIQSLQKITDKNQQVLIQEQVFGEKQILKMSDFLNQDFFATAKQLGNFDPKTLNNSIEKLSQLESLKNALEARRGLQDINGKASIINKGMILSQDQQLKKAQEKEDLNIQSYKDLAKLSMASDEMLFMLRQAVVTFTASLVKITNLDNQLSNMSKAPFWKSIVKFLRVD